MNDDEKFAFRQAQAAAFYEPLKAQANSSGRVGWESEHAHRVRLAAAVAALGLPTRSAEPITAEASTPGQQALGMELQTLLDAGCGEGELLAMLRGRGFNGHYRGEDALPWMVEAAQRSHRQDMDAEFLCADAFDPKGPSADAVVCLGALNTVIDGASPDDTFAETLEALWNRCRVVTVVDFAISDRHPAGSRLATVDPGGALATARALSGCVVWREDGIFGEAQLVMWRDRARPLRRLGADLDPHSLADLLLQAREAEAVKKVLISTRDEQGRLLRAIADAQLGRLRDAERALSNLLGSAVGPSATLHLAAIFRGTGRHREAETLLVKAAVGQDREADEARMMLATMLAPRDPAAAQGWAQAVVDPFIRREALAAVQEA